MPQGRATAQSITAKICKAKGTGPPTGRAMGERRQRIAANTAHVVNREVFIETPLSFYLKHIVPRKTRIVNLFSRK